MNLAGLPAKLSNLRRIGDGFWPGIRIAQTARSQAYSGFLTSLEVAERGAPERDEEDEARESRRSDTDEDDRADGSDPERKEANAKSILSAARADVSELCDCGISRSC